MISSAFDEKKTLIVLKHKEITSVQQWYFVDKK